MVDGLRIDHVDGLYDPARPTWSDCRWKPLYVVVEKILAPHERLPEDWPVHGTTGYEFAALTTSWLVCNDVRNADDAPLSPVHRVRCDVRADRVREQRLVMRSSLAAEIEVLATQLDRIAQLDRHTADFTRAAIREAIREVIACFPVYRTYVSHRRRQRRGPAHRELGRKRRAQAQCRRRAERVRLPARRVARRAQRGQADSMRRAMLEFAMKFQQVTSPVAAKGVEDTAHVSLQPVGLPQRGRQRSRAVRLSSTALHQANAERARLWPHTMLATSTHDTSAAKTSRARIAVLSEMPELWKRHLARWTRLNRSKRRHFGEDPAPDREDEYLLYQTLVGIWSPQEDPATLIERVQATRSKLRARPSARPRGSRRTRSTRRRSPTSSPSCSADPAAQRVPERLSRARRDGGVLRQHQLAGADRAQDRLARLAGFLPGHRAARADAGRSRQSTPRRLRSRLALTMHRAIENRCAACCGSMRRCEQALRDAEAPAAPPRRSRAIRARRLSAAASRRPAQGTRLRIRAHIRGPQLRRDRAALDREADGCRERAAAARARVGRYRSGDQQFAARHGAA